MRKLGLIAFTAAVAIYGGVSRPALAADRNITAVAPLGRAMSNFLDKANGIGPRFRFFLAPQELPSACALSVRAHVNEGEFVDYALDRTLEEFRSRVADSIQLGPSDAERASIHKGFALEGRDRVSGAMCANLKAAPEARGHCFGTISGSGYTIVYTFDPVACGYDNIAVAGSLHARLSVGNRDDREPELDCATKLERFSVDIDNLLAQSPHNITDVFAVLDRHFPLHGCKVDVASDIMKKSRYFRSMTKSTLTTQVFSLSSATASSRGVHVSFGLTDSGESRLPSARWSPPFP